MLTYLCSPYSPKGVTDPLEAKQIREQRFIEVSQMAAKLMEKGYYIFCPIAHSHPIEVYGLPDIKSGDWWLKQDFEIIKHCGLVLIYTMPGWDQSYGIGREIEYARNLGIQVSYIDKDGVISHPKGVCV
jgi:hypothetical protein